MAGEGSQPGTLASQETGSFRGLVALRGGRLCRGAAFALGLGGGRGMESRIVFQSRSGVTTLL